MANYIRWLRSRIGSRKTILVYTTALIRDAEGRLLFQRRTDFDWWGLPGGVVELGETFRDSAVREAAEETGLHVETQRLIGLYASPEWDFAYPNGETADFTPEHEVLVAKAGSESACSTIYGVNDERTNRYALRRIDARQEAIAKFAVRLTVLTA